MKALTRLGQRRYSPAGGYSAEQARELAALSRLLSRQIGLIIDRQGRVELIIVGDASSILIPELPRARTGAGRLRACCTPTSRRTGFPMKTSWISSFCGWTASVC